MIVGPHHLFVGIENVNHHTVILIEVRVAGDNKLVIDVYRASKRCARMAKGDARRRDRRRSRLLVTATGRRAEGQRGQEEHTILNCHDASMIVQLPHLPQSVRVRADAANSRSARDDRDEGPDRLG